MTPYNLQYLFTMIVWIGLVILVATVTILAGNMGCRVTKKRIYKMQNCHLLAIATVIIYMSTEPHVISILKLLLQF